ncbi:hypothetical protein FACS18945_2480 [Bacteroidia bacterium]|nr:hypothetical protein FACS18945_2480 [Bacteroidia bacterium]
MTQVANDLKNFLTPDQVDLSSLPAPKVVEELSFEAIFQELLADFKSRRPDYDALLESDPVIIALECSAYRELLLRHRINEAAKANMLAYATGSDLDNLAAFYGIERMEDESDERLRYRTNLALEGLTTAGSEKAYLFHALTASPSVRSASVQTPAAGQVVITILSIDGNGAADAELLAAVNDYVSDETAYAGSMQREFAARSATTENNLQLLKNQMAVLATNVGSTLLPTLNAVVGIFGRAAGTLAEFAEKHPTMIKYVGLAVAGMASFKVATFALGYGFTFLKGGALSIMGVFQQVRTIFSLVRLGLGGLIPIIRAVGMAFISNPIGLIITGIVVGATLLIKYWKSISKFFKDLFAPVVAVFKQVWNWITNLWEKAKNIFDGIKSWVKDSWVGKAWNGNIFQNCLNL